MPYRRLPNTDKARLRALETALRKSVSSIRIFNIACTEETLASIQVFLPKFQSAVLNLEATRKQQYQKNKEFIEISKKARLYISHFIQVVNFSILRGEIKKEIRDFYFPSQNDKNLPKFNSDKNLLDWGKKIIDGEQQRIIKGGNPIYNPSIALVKVNYEKFVDAYRFQNILNANTERLSGIVSDLRKEVDKTILDIWNEVEKYFEGFPDSDKREKASEYGVVYVWRKKEMKKLKQQEQMGKEMPLDRVIPVSEVKHQDLIMEPQKIKITEPVEQKKPVKKTKIEHHNEHSPVQAVLNF